MRWRAMPDCAARFGPVFGFASRALRAVLLWEVRCGGCGRVMRGAACGALCPQCAGAIVPLQRGACPGCGEMSVETLDVPLDGMPGGMPGQAVAETDREEQAGLCARCQASPRPWSRVLVYGEYQGRLKDMILGYKFSARLDFGRRLQECALAAFEAGLAAHPELSGCEGLVPVPLHPRRLLARGFNQSRELARLISARRGLPIWQEALVRVRRTTPQMRLARGARAENIRGAFAGRAELVAGRQLLLVDDIMTTGATLEECARALLDAGAKRVDVLALARA